MNYADYTQQINVSQGISVNASQPVYNIGIPKDDGSNFLVFHMFLSTLSLV